MKLTISNPITDLKGQPIKQGDETLTLKEVLQNSLLFDNPQEKQDGIERYRRYKLQEKVAKANDTVDMTVEEAALAKKCIGQSFYTTLAMGRAFDLIEASKGD